MYVYHTNPIDFWDGWQRPSEVFKVGDHYYAQGPIEPSYLTPKLWEETWERAKAGALKLGWEGDIREGPYIAMCPIPDGGPEYNGDGTFFVAWKQDNNGETFIASPFRLPWLHNDYDSYVVVERRRAA